MRCSKHLVLILTLFIISGISGILLAGNKQPEIVKYRKKLMKSYRNHNGAISDIQKGKLNLKAHLVFHGKALWDGSKLVKEVFPKGSGDTMTRARSEIWKKPGVFQKKITAFEMETEKLFQLLSKSDSGRIQKQIKFVKASCSSCHKDFRLKKNKKHGHKKYSDKKYHKK